ncbi:MAG TPA: fibronectin type III domain-containing protein, partial [Acidimicrobiales bacterium]|nr:fibronectin type III domain-containing protein [Acidimicrobiales bacterium]
MHKLTKRLATLVVAVSTLGGASLIVGLGALPASAATTISFSGGSSVQPACAAATCVAGQPLSTEPVVQLAGNSATASVLLSIASGPGTLHCSTNPAVATGIGGTASWGTCTVNQAGTYTLQADDTTDGVVSAPSASFTVDQPHLVFSHQPVNPSVAGDNNGVQISLENSSNVVVPSTNADTIQLTIASGPGTLNCGTENLAAGVADFSTGVCSINLSGMYTLAATDITDGNVAGAISNSFTVNPNIPNQLAVVDSPALNSNVGLNTDFPVSVAVEDQFGNIITTTPASTTVHLVITPLTGTPGATLTCPTYVTNTAAVTPGTGEATFIDGCSINTAGSGYTLTATSSPAYNQSISPAFDVATTPPAVTTLAAGGINGTSVTLNGSINNEGAATSYQFEYSTTDPLTSPTFTPLTSLGGSGSAQAVSATITGLTPGTTYFYALVTTTDGTGSILSVTTGVVTTLAATAVTGTTATLNGSINDEGVATSYQFEYGTSSTLATSTLTALTSLAASTGAQSVSAAITGLTPGTTYYFELVTTTDGSGGILNFANGLVS